MMFSKKIVAGMVVAVTAVLLAGCATQTISDPPATPPTVRELSFTSNLLGEDVWESLGEEPNNAIGLMEDAPFVSDVTEDSFILVDGGSGSCVDVIDSVVWDAGEKVLTVSYEEPDPGVACTMDYRLRAYEVKVVDDFKPAVVLDDDSVKFFVEKFKSDSFPLKVKGEVFTEFLMSR